MLWPKEWKVRRQTDQNKYHEGKGGKIFFEKENAESTEVLVTTELHRFFRRRKFGWLGTVGEKQADQGVNLPAMTISDLRLVPCIYRIYCYQVQVLPCELQDRERFQRNTRKKCYLEEYLIIYVWMVRDL